MVLYGALIALGFGGTSVSLFSALSAKWFHRHRGLAIGLALGGSCLGQYILVPVMTMAMLRWGWRSAFMAMGIVILVVNLLLIFRVIRDHPGQLGLEPYGRDPAKDLSARTARATAGPLVGEDFDLKAALRTRSFWLFLVIMVICGGGDSFILTHLIPMATDHGISPSTAGHMLAWSGLLSLPGVLITGPVTDRIGNKIPIMITFALRLVLFSLVLKYQTLVSFYILALVFGFTNLITAPICVTLLGRMYGFLHVGLLSGFITTLHHLGGGAWAFLGGYIFDQTGSYHLAFLLSAISAAVAVVCAVFIREERHRKIAA
jgi:predicted MFS family arabinose efflux permease